MIILLLVLSSAHLDGVLIYIAYMNKGVRGVPQVYHFTLAKWRKAVCLRFINQGGGFIPLFEVLAVDIKTPFFKCTM